MRLFISTLERGYQVDIVSWPFLRNEACNNLAEWKGPMCHCCVSRNPGFLYLRNPPHPASLNGWPASPTEGEAVCFIPLNSYRSLKGQKVC